MLLNFWGRTDKAGMPDKPPPTMFAPASPPRSPLSPIRQIPLFNKMKRKRANSGSGPPDVGFPPNKKWAETISHVEIPRVPAPPVSVAAPTIATNENVLSARQHISSTEAGTQDHLPQPNTTHNLDLHLHSPVRHTSMSQHLINSMPHPTKPVVDSGAIRQAIESQFSLEILLKHQELRLIDQELAKCQAALEQLRRCRVVPYPSTQSSAESIDHVVHGSGPVYGNTASHAPSWGVTNGPYSRHYARWLLQDPAFDNTFVEPSTPLPSGKTLPERSTRGAKAEKSLTGSSRSQRGSNARLKALPHGYGEAKEEKGPMIVKRSSDEKMVKLVCLDCRRSNFNSAQGFINHCRIAHGRQFASHDAAIEACGEDIDAEEEAITEPASGRTVSSVGLVHPLIRSAHLMKPGAGESTGSPVKKRRRQSSPHPVTASAVVRQSGREETHTQQPIEDTIPPPAKTNNEPLKPCSRTPYLSGLFARVGKGGDLDMVVADATTKMDIDLDEIGDNDDGEEEDVVEIGHSGDEPKSRSTRGVVSGDQVPFTVLPTASAARRQGPNPAHHPDRAPAQADAPPPTSQSRPHPPPFHLQPEGSSQGFLDMQTPLNLSPNTTDPHPAPSLVSDDGDHETAHTDSENSCSADEDDSHHYLGTEVMDQDDIVMGEAPLAIAPTSAKHGHQHEHSRRPLPQSPLPVRRPHAYHVENNLNASPENDQHVSFASPTRNSRRGTHHKQ